MFLQKMYYPVKLLALISFLLMAAHDFRPNDIFFYLLLSPYAVLFYLANSNNYVQTNVAVLRLIAAVITFMIAPLYFYIESDPQAGIGEVLYLILQLTAISAAEFIILFFKSSDK